METHTGPTPHWVEAGCGHGGMLVSVFLHVQFLMNMILPDVSGSPTDTAITLGYPLTNHQEEV